MSSFIRKSGRFVNLVNRCVNWSVWHGRRQILSTQDKSETKILPATDREGLQLSDACVKQLKKLKEGDNSFLRVVVEGGGCSGFQYKFVLDSNVNEAEDRYFGTPNMDIFLTKANHNLQTYVSPVPDPDPLPLHELPLICHGVFEREGVCVVVDQDSVQFLNGSTVDYHQELIRAAFRIINNPKAEQGCSCGASFSLKM